MGRRNPRVTLEEVWTRPRVFQARSGMTYMRGGRFLITDPGEVERLPQPFKAFAAEQLLGGVGPFTYYDGLPILFVDLDLEMENGWKIELQRVEAPFAWEEVLSGLDHGRPSAPLAAHIRRVTPGGVVALEVRLGGLEPVILECNKDGAVPVAGLDRHWVEAKIIVSLRE